MRVPPKNLKGQLSGIISYLSENRTNSPALSRHKSVSALVAKLLVDWKALPEGERKKYMDLECEETRDKNVDEEHKD